MGRWLARHLAAQGQQITLLDRDTAGLEEAGRQLEVQTATDLGVASGAEALVLAVPITSFEDAAQALAPYVHAGQLVLDITSVKVAPTELMHRYFPHSTTLGTHPVFGPGADGVRAQNVVLTPTETAENVFADRLEEILKGYGANVVQMSPARHDQLMAAVLGLAHYIALVVGDTLLSLDDSKEFAQVGGPTFRALLTLVESVLREDPALYSAIQMHLPALPDLEQGFVAKAQWWAELVAKRDAAGFQDRMSSLRHCLSEQL